jgi:hypothetical protein
MIDWPQIKPCGASATRGLEVCQPRRHRMMTFLSGTGFATIMVKPTSESNKSVRDSKKKKQQLPGIFRHSAS